MLRTQLCELIGIDVPVIQAGMSVYTSPELAAAVSEAGALGSLGVWQRSPDQLRAALDELRERTDRPFALNHVVPDLDEEAFAASLAARPAVVSFALDHAGPLVARAHDAGSLAMQQVSTVEQAERAVAAGVDIVVAQGGEAGGFAGGVATLALAPQVVDAVAPVPVVAAGGIADGRGLAAALVLGAVGVNLGSRFLASAEAPVGQRWKELLRSTPAEDWVKLGFVNDIRPIPGTVGYGTTVRGRRNAFTEHWEARRDELRADPTPAIAEMREAVEAGTIEELLIFGGQSAGLIRDTPPVADIVRRLVTDAEEALRDANSVVTAPTSSS
jgi:nitronate monooxygenase/enoyl-[acyl-carrier protein] reductase II